MATRTAGAVAPRSEQELLLRGERLGRAMIRARLLEEKLGSLYRAGRIVGGVYLSFLPSLLTLPKMDCNSEFALMPSLLLPVFFARSALVAFFRRWAMVSPWRLARSVDLRVMMNDAILLHRHYRSYH